MDKSRGLKRLAPFLLHRPLRLVSDLGADAVPAGIRDRFCKSAVLIALAEMDEAIGEYVAEKPERIGREWRERRAFEKWKQAQDKRAHNLIGLGTSVLVRLCVRDDPDRGGAPARFRAPRHTDPRVRHRANSPGHASPQSARQGCIDGDCRKPAFTRRVRRWSAMMAAARWYRSKSTDFADYFVAALEREARAAPTCTFDGGNIECGLSLVS